MQDKTLNEMVDVVITWATEQGNNYPNGLELENTQSTSGQKPAKENYPREVCEFLNVVKSEIAKMSESSLRKFENALLHVPGERRFTRGQISMLNTLRSAVFLEIDKRQNKLANQPGA